jgi:ubiquinone/menaquinone biosynthesis C-methylase UbiE
MGAHALPHPRSTHAVDIVDKKSVLWAAENEQDMHDKREKPYGYTTKRILENRLKKIDYRFNFNYNTQKLPWPNNYFDTIYSQGSLHAYGKPFAYKEIYRVLKQGGRLIYDIGDTRERLNKHFKMLKEIGFASGGIHNAGTYVYKGKERIGGKMWVYKK